MSSPFWWNCSDGFGELHVKAWIYRTMLDCCACPIRPEIVASFPIMFRPDWPGKKTSAAIRADIVQDVLDASTAEGAFKRANHRRNGIWRKRRVAVLASRSQCEHDMLMFRVGAA